MLYNNFDQLIMQKQFNFRGIIIIDDKFKKLGPDPIIFWIRIRLKHPEPAGSESATLVSWSSCSYKISSSFPIKTLQEMQGQISANSYVWFQY